MTVEPVRTIFLGSGGFGRQALRALAATPSVELVGVVTAPPRPAGRSRQPTPTVIETTARELGIAPVLTPERLRAPDAVEAVLALRPGLLVLADYGQIVPVALLDVQHGALNLHPSLLPRHRGATPIPAAIAAGDPVTGVSLMRMDAGLDTGPIVAQARVDLDGTETAPDLEERLAELGAWLLAGELDAWLAGATPARPQDAAGATLTRPLRREDGRLDPTRPAAELARQVRALQPWPGTFIETDEGRLAIHRAEPEAVAPGEPGEPSHTAGTASVGRLDELGLVTAEGRLRLLEVQPAGGRRMPWAAYVRGRPGILGRTIGSPPSGVR
ncbi:MAG: methionyl-tRNA formyltransferase [Candidatus Limnocylindria bacterium]